MDEAVIQSLAELQGFIKYFDLKDRNSNVRFSAIIKIKTMNNEIMTEGSVMVTLQDYNVVGKLDFFSDIDLNLFPSSFQCDYQDFRFVNNSFLRITGHHTRNPLIGDYAVEIFPLKNGNPHIT